MTIPKSFKFMGYRWRVLMMTPPRGDDWGCTDFANQIIYIEPAMSDGLIQSTFIHEVLHVVLWATGAEYGVEKDVEEKIVNSMANGLWAAVQAGVLKF